MMATSSDDEPVVLNLIMRNSGKPTFDDQITLVKSVGASFDSSTGTWWVSLERALTGNPPGIDVLFEAAAQHQTRVHLERRPTKKG